MHALRRNLGLKTHRCTVSFLPAEGSEEHLKRFREAFPNSSGHTFPRNSATTNGALKVSALTLLECFHCTHLVVQSIRVTLSLSSDACINRSYTLIKLSQ